jgi:hypothetical protein
MGTLEKQRADLRVKKEIINADIYRSALDSITQFYGAQLE